MTVTSGTKLLMALLGVDVPEVSRGVPTLVGVRVSIVAVIETLPVFPFYSAPIGGFSLRSWMKSDGVSS
jgi:hypothetical protein